MTTAIDTNVLVALWRAEDALNRRAAEALGRGHKAGERFVICGPVYAELLAGSLRGESELDARLEDGGVTVEWSIEETVWRLGGAAFKSYADARRRMREGVPRRMLADFVIGAHASVRGYRLLTLDARFFRSRFAGLRVIGF